MKRILSLVIPIFILGAGMAAAGYCLACRLPASSRDSKVAEERSDLMNPVKVVQEYVARSSSCGALKLDDLTQPIPDEHMRLLFDADDNYLEKRFETPDGFISLADNARVIYLEFITRELPQFICARKYSFGKLLKMSLDGDFAAVTVNFVTPEGVFDSTWKFLLQRNRDGWHAFYLADPSNEEIGKIRSRIKDWEKNRKKTAAETKRQTGTNLRFNDRP